MADLRSIIDALQTASRKDDPFDFTDLYDLLIVRREKREINQQVEAMKAIVPIEPEPQSSVPKEPSLSGLSAILPQGFKKLTQDFGVPVSYEPSGRHEGLDFSASLGTPVGSFAEGVVTNITKKGPFGLSVLVKHTDGTQSRYSHLSSTAVKQGDFIQKGQSIGAVGSSGHSTGPHLDFRLYNEQGRSIDPKPFL